MHKLKGFVTPEKAKYQADILSNRIRNRFRHLSKRFRRQGIDCFRLYNWDIPEIRAVVDWYAGHVVIGEYVRLQTGPEWLPQMAQAVAQTLNLAPKNIHFKHRQTKAKEGPRYSRMGFSGERLEVHERDLRFLVNLDDFLDTGLYSDHRDTRVIVKKLARDKNFLNLYGYTGAFTCAAAAGGAKSTTTIDRSITYLKWAKDNLELNGFMGPQHALVQSDVAKFLTRTFHEGRRFTLAVVDPPSFFNDKASGISFDINRDHRDLLQDVLKVMVSGSLIFFSTNHQMFEPKFGNLAVKDLAEITSSTIPEDFRNRPVHRSWRMTVA